MRPGSYRDGRSQRILRLLGGTQEPTKGDILMATTSFTELSHRRVGRSRGFMRTILDRVVEAREREARRYIEDRLSIAGSDELSSAIRQSLFEGRAPERR